MSGNWLWTADHDIEDGQLRQITIFNGRGLYIDATAGPLWLWGTAVEHHVLYEYQLNNAKNIFMGEIQTETAYYQPNPDATIPFPAEAAWSDPVFPAECYAENGFVGRNYTGDASTFNNPCDGWGLRVLGSSSDILVYGAGLYSFFANNDVLCAQNSTNPGCQDGVFEVQEGASVSVYGLNTIGVKSMVDLTDGSGGRGGAQSLVQAADNVAGFANGLVSFRI